MEWVDIVNGSLESRVTRRSFERVWKREGWKLKEEKPQALQKDEPEDQESETPVYGGFAK